MNDEDRIAALERELAQLRANFSEYGTIHQYEIGQSQAYRAAITALIAAHPSPAQLAQQMAEHIARVEADVVSLANAEERLQGLQAAQSYLLEICDIAQRLYRTPN